MQPQNDHEDLHKIAHDLDRCDVLDAIGSRSQRSEARRHRAACFRHIHELNERDGLTDISDEELLSELQS